MWCAIRRSYATWRGNTRAVPLRERVLLQVAAIRRANNTVRDHEGEQVLDRYNWNVTDDFNAAEREADYNVTD
jgi:hypothetical protein